MFLLTLIIEHKNSSLNLKKRKYTNYCILIPARNESRVIEGLLTSIEAQTDLDNTYVIVEDIEDPTCEIVKKHGGNIILRKDLTKKRKGYALDEALKQIKKEYDLYFIFDADNILDKNFLKKMLETYEKGYDIATGYRNIKNSKNVITSCSGLTFSMINTLFNKHFQALNKTITISGTGYYISGDLIKKWGGFPFHSLTEDYELSLYASGNNITTYYNNGAIFYDEQPDKMKISIMQRTRWVKGFLEARKIRLKNIADAGKILGITPYLFMIGGILLFLLTNIFQLIKNLLLHKSYFLELNYLIITILTVYFILVIMTLMIILKDQKLNLSFSNKIKTILFNPIFLCTYIICLVKALTTNVSWDKIEHSETKIKKA